MKGETRGRSFLGRPTRAQGGAGGTSGSARAAQQREEEQADPGCTGRIGKGFLSIFHFFSNFPNTFSNQISKGICKPLQVGQNHTPR
jgi:hypothetical protein